MLFQRVFGAGALAALLLAPLGVAAPGLSGTDTIGANKNGIACNEIVTNQITDKVRDYDKHPPSPTDRAALTARYDSLADLLGQYQREDLVVRGVVCHSDSGRGPVEAQLAAGTAWALALQSDVLVQLWASQCPAAARELPASVLADAWVTLAGAMPGSPANDAPTPSPGPSGVVPTPEPIPKSVAEVIPKIQTRAAAVNLALPAFGDATDYWVRQIREQANSTVTSCPKPAGG